MSLLKWLQGLAQAFEVCVFRDEDAFGTSNVASDWQHGDLLTDGIEQALQVH